MTTLITRLAGFLLFLGASLDLWAYNRRLQ